MTEEYIDPDFPEMESQPEEIPELEVFKEEFYEETPIPDELDVLSALEYPPQEGPTVMDQDSGGVLFLPEDDPIYQPVISEPLDSRLVYTRPVSRRLRHLTCERRGPEYQRPVGLYRPGN